jgi:deoxyadenosine/deoxycytidine kinase
MANDVADYAERSLAVSRVRTLEVPRVISLEGNIGAGKSTLLQRLKDRFAGDDNVVFVDEPVDEWTHHGFLHRAYTEATIGLPFQMMVLASLICDLRNAVFRKPVPRLVFTERSPLGNYRVFAKVNLGDADMRMFEFTFNRLMTTLPAGLEVEYLFLRADTSTLSKRIRERGRPAESDIPATYLGVLNELHDTWLLPAKDISSPRRKHARAARASSTGPA